jgi:alkaline phosphatase
MPVVVFLHHRLDASFENSIYGPRNAAEIRKILEDSGNVLIVFQGHEHAGALSRINRITYYTLKGMVEGSGAENNSYIIAEIGRDLSVRITGYRNAASGEFN